MNLVQSPITELYKLGADPLKAKMDLMRVKPVTQEKSEIEKQYMRRWIFNPGIPIDASKRPRLSQKFFPRVRLSYLEVFPMNQENPRRYMSENEPWMVAMPVLSGSQVDEVVAVYKKYGLVEVTSFMDFSIELDNELELLLMPEVPETIQGTIAALEVAQIKLVSGDFDDDLRRLELQHIKAGLKKACAEYLAVALRSCEDAFARYDTLISCAIQDRLNSATTGKRDYDPTEKLMAAVIGRTADLVHPDGNKPDTKLAESIEALAKSNQRNTPALPDRAMKVCPDCASDVYAEARKCRFCDFRFDGLVVEPKPKVATAPAKPPQVAAKPPQVKATVLVKPATPTKVEVAVPIDNDRL